MYEFSFCLKRKSHANFTTGANETSCTSYTKFLILFHLSFEEESMAGTITTVKLWNTNEDFIGRYDTLKENGM